MTIKYDTDGRIMSCSKIPGILTGDRALVLDDGDVPPDLLTTFALGKYVVRDDRLVLNKSDVTAVDDPEGEETEERVASGAAEVHSGKGAVNPSGHRAAKARGSSDVPASSSTAGKVARRKPTKGGAKPSGKRK